MNSIRRATVKSTQREPDMDTASKIGIALSVSFAWAVIAVQLLRWAL